MNTPTPTPTDRPTADEALESLTGFEEQAIQRQFGVDLIEMAGKMQTTFMRALAFILMKRSGSPDATAYDRIMKMRSADVQDMFSDDEEEFIPEDPSTESGKDDSEPANGPMTSPGGASPQANPPMSTNS